MVQVGEVPVQPPLQLVKLAPLAGEAVGATVAPSTNVPFALAQRVPQLIPDGDDFTVPSEELVLVTPSVRAVPIGSVRTDVLFEVSGSTVLVKPPAVTVCVSEPSPEPATTVP